MRCTSTNELKYEEQDGPEIRKSAPNPIVDKKRKVALNVSQQESAGKRPNVILTKNNDLRMAQVGSESSSTDASHNEAINNMDDESVFGHFGWAELGEFCIPYIFRNGEKYCAVRMVEMELFNKYLSCLHEDLYSCISVPSYYITKAESMLLNEINIKHCENQFGCGWYTTRDLIVSLSDANEFYNYLSVCYSKLVEGKNTTNDRCGFLHINKENVVAYTVKNDIKYLPLFYFESDLESLKVDTEQLEGWDLTYLKFCCKVQGIRNELIGDNSCTVINLNIIKSYFPPETQFDIYWPRKDVDFECLLKGNNCTQVNQLTQPLTSSVTPKGQTKVYLQRYPVRQLTPRTAHIWTFPGTMPSSKCQPSRPRYLRQQRNAMRTTYNYCQ